MLTFTAETTQPKALNDYTVEDIRNIITLAKDEARGAAEQHIKEHGEQWYCGFAWVNIWDIKGNTKLGKRMKAAGLDKDYTGSYSIWNPSSLGTQCMSTKEAGARAAAKVYTAAGFTAYAGSRAD